MDVKDVIQEVDDAIGIAIAMGQVEISDRYGFPLNEEDTRMVAAIALRPLVDREVLTDASNMLDSILTGEQPSESLPLNIDVSAKE